MLNKIIKFLGSMQVMSLLILIFAFSIGFATFIENDFGRSSSKALIFNTWWFECILILLVFNLINNLFKFKLFRWEKIAALTFHLSFIFILIGSAVTRYISYEGMMHIREGDSTNLFISDDTFLQIHIDDRNLQYKYHKKLFLSGITSNDFDLRARFKDHDITIQSVAFFPNVKDSLSKDNIVGLDISSKNSDLTSASGTNISVDQMVNRSLTPGSVVSFKSFDFSLDSLIEGGFNFQIDKQKLQLVTHKDISIMSMPPGVDGATSYLQGDSISIKGTTLITVDSLRFVIDPKYDGKEMLFSSSNVMKDGSEDALVINVTANGESKQVTLYGGKGYKGSEQVFSINNLNFKLSYGSKYYTTPFRVKLRDFQLERYPGSMNPSSYAAEVSILDGEMTSDHRIFMNNVLNYGGYRFFQSSYDKDEKGTILSVNHDWWGTLITYIGYFFLALGFILVFLTNKTRYKSLSDKLKKLSAIVILSFFMITPSKAHDTNMQSIHHTFSDHHIAKFDRLVIQDHGGRFKPVHTLTSDYLRKICGRDHFDDRSATDIILSMMYNPRHWSNENIIKVSNPRLRNMLSDIDSDARYILVSFNDLYHNLDFAKDVDRASSKSPKDRDQYDKDVLKVSERFNICFSIFAGGIFRFFPVPSDSNNTWLAYTEADQFSEDSVFVSNIIPMYLQGGLKQGFEQDDWYVADTILGYIKQFQLKNGSNVLPDQHKVDLEIIYNKLNIFSNLFIYYFLSGVLLLIMVIIRIFSENNFLRYSIQFLKWVIVAGFVAHTIGLALRWYISGHAPWSNGYESMIYIAWATVLSGISFSSRSLLTLSATSVVSGLLLMVAHLNWLDPQITNLVPVLKSYWLMIHVAIITASYGFFSLSSLLGLISLYLIIFTNGRNKYKLKSKLDELTIINEKSLEIGLFMLAIGTFLGGVWANESWGRYWGWDPKETWALVSVLLYSFVLHMRFIPALKGPLTFNIASMFAIWTIIMTYFGVNYYLSGLHSYAAGDPMPIPSFVYYLSALMLITAIIAKLRYKVNY